MKEVGLVLLKYFIGKEQWVQRRKCPWLYHPAVHLSMFFSHNFSNLMGKESLRKIDGYLFNSHLLSTRDRKYKKLINVWSKLKISNSIRSMNRHNGSIRRRLSIPYFYTKSHRSLLGEITLDSILKDGGYIPGGVKVEKGVQRSWCFKSLFHSKNVQTVLKG